MSQENQAYDNTFRGAVFPFNEEYMRGPFTWASNKECFAVMGKNPENPSTYTLAILKQTKDGRPDWDRIIARGVVFPTRLQRREGQRGDPPVFRSHLMLADGRPKNWPKFPEGNNTLTVVLFAQGDNGKVGGDYYQIVPDGRQNGPAPTFRPEDLA